MGESPINDQGPPTTVGVDFQQSAEKSIAFGATGAGGGGGIQQIIHSRTEEYVYVTRNDLRELATFGWLHQTLMVVGTFFFSGAFWQTVATIAGQPKFELTAWIGMYLVSMLAGAVLAVIGLVLFATKQRKLSSYFP